MGEPTEFLLDTGATFPLLTTQKGPLHKRKCNIKGVSGKGNTRKFFEPLTCEIDSKNLKILLAWSRMCDASVREKEAGQVGSHYASKPMQSWDKGAQITEGYISGTPYWGSLCAGTYSCPRTWSSEARSLGRRENRLSCECPTYKGFKKFSGLLAKSKTIPP